MCLLLLLLSVSSLSVSGQTSSNPQDYMMVDGVAYFKTDKEKKEVCVHWLSAHAPYKGSVVVPERVTYRNEVWTVTGVGESCFLGSKELTSVILPKTVRMIDDGAFLGCVGLKELVLPSALESIGPNAFSGLLLKEIKLPQTVTTIGESAFENCTSLVSMDLPAGLERLSDYLFSGCTALAEVTLPTGLKRIGGRAFDECVSLEKIALPEGLSSIGTMAFHRCSSLKELTIPSTVTEMGDGAFVSCSGIVSITTAATFPPLIYQKTFDGLYHIPLTVPYQCAAVYRAASCWSQFSDIREKEKEESQLSIVNEDGGDFLLQEFESLQLGLDVSFESSDLNVADVDEWGVVFANGPGECRIKAVCGKAVGFVDIVVSDVSRVVDAKSRELTVSAVNGLVCVRGVADGETVSLFDVGGVKVAEKLSAGGKAVLPTQSDGVFIVRLSDGTAVKVAVRRD